MVQMLRTEKRSSPCLALLLLDLMLVAHIVRLCIDTAKKVQSLPASVQM